MTKEERASPALRWAEWTIIAFLVVAVVAIGVPGYFSAKRAGNERNASGSAKQFGSVEVTFKTTDADENSINDYWTADVAGLYYVCPTGHSAPIRMIEFAVVTADGRTDMTNAQITYAPPVPPHVSEAKDGYWFMAQRAFYASKTNFEAYGRRNTDRFSFVAAPNEYGSGGRLVFVISEGGTLYKRV